jgi:carbonic anhydrase/acetyltransferase-like protein (isoleucine patch superfamily)
MPFGDRVGELPVLDRTLSEFRHREITRARVHPESLTFADYAFATAPVLEAFRRTARGDQAFRLALPANNPNQIFAPVSSVSRDRGRLLYDIFLNAPVQASLEELRQNCEPLLVDLSGRSHRRVLPKLGTQAPFVDLPNDGAVAGHFEHWVHPLWITPCLVPAFLGRKRNLVGRNAKIHPRAHLDGAIVGEDSVVGPGCVIRNSYVGAHSHLSDFTKIRNSVLGDHTHTLADASFSHVVSFGGATLANLLLRDVILGRNVFVTTGVIFWNQSLDKTITVLHRGEEHDTQRMALGGCAGHGCVLGARAILAPGRALPNRTTVVMRKEESVHKIQAAPTGTAMCWHNGALVPAPPFLYEGLPDELEDDRRKYSSGVASEPQQI